MGNKVYLYILGMFLVSYLIRVLPLTLIRRDITNRTVRSFLYYVPYVTLAVMTFPGMLEVTEGSGQSVLARALALAAGIGLAWFGGKYGKLMQVAVLCVLVVFVVELFV